MLYLALRAYFAPLWCGVMTPDLHRRFILGRWQVEDAVKMYELQRVDLTWTKVARRLQQLQQLLGESDELKSARQQVSEIEAELHDWHAKQKNAELEDKS